MRPGPLPCRPEVANLWTARPPPHVIIPLPLPRYSLAPDVPSLETAPRAAVERCLRSVVGLAGAALVMDVTTTAEHHVIDLQTEAGRLLLLERRGGA